MKIVMIHGQNHVGSSCHIGRMLVEALGSGNEVTEFFLPRDLPHFCLGCYRCITDDTACPYYAEKHRIMEQVEQADLLILTTPNYCMLPSAPMKAFIDLTFTYWMSHRPRTCMFSKRAAVISTTAGMGARQAILGVKRTLLYWGIPYVKGYGIGVQAMNWDGVRQAKKDKIGKDITWLARRLSSKKAPHVGLKTRLFFLMMRGMQKAGMSSSPVEVAYWQEQGWLDQQRPWKKSRSEQAK